MVLRSTMAGLITRVRLLINDPAGPSQVFADQDIQDTLDASREDIYNLAMKPQVTFSGSDPIWVDYLTRQGDWEDDFVIKQYLTVVTTPVTNEPIAGHWHFAATTLPPLYITGKIYDRYRAAADLLEMWAARLTLSFDFTSDGQSFRRSQMHSQMLDMALHYRMKQRARTVNMFRNDINVTQTQDILSPGPHDLDYFSSGDKQ